MEIGDVVLISDNLRNIPFAISVSREACRVIHQNLAFEVGCHHFSRDLGSRFALPLPIGVVRHEGSTSPSASTGCGCLPIEAELRLAVPANFRRRKSKNRRAPRGRRDNVSLKEKCNYAQPELGLLMTHNITRVSL